MISRKPIISTQMKICIICEGYEEYEYLEKLINLNVWNKNYKFILINAESNGKIPARYNDAYVNSSYDIVLIFCDTDQKPYEDYTTIKKKINNIHGNKKSANHITIFANPCTMQIILLHFSMIQLSSHIKEDNKVHIKKFTKIGSYRAKQEQRDRLFTTINLENYKFMMSNCKTLPNDDTITGTSNFSIFLDRFSNNDTVWIDEINKVLQEEEFKIAIKK